MLADALYYVSSTYKPHTVIDAATVSRPFRFRFGFGFGFGDGRR